MIHFTHISDSNKTSEDVIRFNEDSSSVIRHALGECAVLLVTFNSSDNVKPIQFTW